MLCLRSIAMALAVALATSVVAHASPAPAPTGRAADIEATLREFHANPSAVMNARPPKRDENGQIIPRPRTAFSPSEIVSREFVTDRDQVRARLCTETGGARRCVGDVVPGRAAFESDDLAAELVDSGITMARTLQEMEERELMSSELDESPWSDDYWAIYKGVLGARYADPRFPADEDWKKNRDYVSSTRRTLEAIFAAHNSSSIDRLSPSEKYDLLVGSPMPGTLTRRMWSEGESYVASSGSVETWMGICHGWAPAAYMLPRPAGTVTVLAADGRTRIKFYPSDIKALASLLWANGETRTKFAGGRCNDKTPQTDRNGRVTSQECFDNNPGTWHLVTVNQIGLARRSFVLDTTYDYEVWNQPVHGYSYTYFNPETGDETDVLADATIDLSEYRRDKFRSYRGERAKKIVGVAMDVTYVVETEPSHARRDRPENDELNTVRYLYDLELDARGKIIGGEWYNNEHPDFLWTPPKGARAVSSADRFLRGSWDGDVAMPQTWQRAADRASGQGQPLAAVVETLITLSRTGSRN